MPEKGQSLFKTCCMYRCTSLLVESFVARLIPGTIILMDLGLSAGGGQF